MRTNITKKIIVAGAAGAQPLALLIGAALAALGFTANAHADSGNREFLAAMHGQEPGTTRMTAVKVPGGVRSCCCWPTWPATPTRWAAAWPPSRL
jgi:hypothetical protein